MKIIPCSMSITKSAENKGEFTWDEVKAKEGIYTNTEAGYHVSFGGGCVIWVPKEGNYAMRAGGNGPDGYVRVDADLCLEIRRR